MLYDISEKAKQEISKYCDNYEIYLEKEELLELDAQKTNLNFAKEEITIGIGIRVINNNKLGFAYTSDINQIDKTAKQAFLNSKLNEEDKYLEFASDVKTRPIKGTFDKNYKNFTLEDGSEFLENMIKLVKEEKCEVTSGGFSGGFAEELIVNSNGLCAYDKSTAYGVYIAVNAMDGEELSTSYDSIASCKFDLNGEKLTENVCKIAKDSIGGENIETQDTGVVLNYHAASGLLNNLINGLNGENVIRKRSILHDKLNEEILSTGLNIYDDNGYIGGLNSGAFDGEGTPSEKTRLVENGILKNFIFDIYNGNKAGKKSTGNGYRSPSSTPSISSSNVIFDYKDEIDINEINNGVLVTDVLGAHTTNPITGDFSVEMNNAFKIENGEIRKPIKKAMLSGNIYESLKNSIAVKSEIKQKGSFIIPKIFISKLRVVGQ